MRGTMEPMRVDNPDHHPHDHGFGTGAGEAEAHAVGVGLGGEQESTEQSGHGLFDHIGDVAHTGGHAEVGQLEYDFGQHHDGLHGLHDSIGLGYGGGDEHHALHDSSLHENHHVPVHEAPDPAVDHHHDLGDIGHHG